MFQPLYLEFAEKIVRPYYSGNISEALKDLFRNVIRDEDFFLSHTLSVESGDYG
jgi:hypothetical protein